MTYHPMEFDPTAFERFDIEGISESDDIIEIDYSKLLLVKEQEGSYRSRSSLKQCIILIVECTKAIWQQQMSNDVIDTTTIWQEVVSGLAELLKSKIVSTANDKIAVILFGVDSTQNDLSVPGVHVLLDLDFVDATRIVYLSRLAQISSEKDFAQQVVRPCEPNCDTSSPCIGDLFWVCNQLFVTKSNISQYKNKVLLFTCEDDPCRGHPEHRKSAIQRIQDLQEALADFELFPLHSPGRTFDLMTFYADALTINEEDLDTFHTTSLTKLEDIKSKIRARQHPQRILGRIPLILGDGLQLTVGIFTSIIQARTPFPIYMDSSDNTPLKSETKYICEETGTLLSAEQIKKYISYGNEKTFIPEEARSIISRFKGVDVGMRLIGFKPSDRITIRHNIKHPYFVYPLEAPPYGTKGSAILCQALIVRMAQLKQAAIVRWVERQNAPPRFAALLSQIEEVDEHGEQLSPPGFHLIPLPFAEDIRHLRIESSMIRTTNTSGEVIADEDELIDTIARGVEQAKDVIMGFSLADALFPQDLENPVLQQFYLGIEALAVGQTEILETADNISQELETIEDALKDSVNKWRETVYGSGSTPDGASRFKGKSTIKNTSEPKKRSQPPIATNSTNSSIIQEAAANGQLSKLTVTTLKTWLSNNGLPVSGLKAELLGRIELAIGKKRKTDI